MDQITQGDLANLTTLNASGLGISNLTGLQLATNLTNANLSNNNIASFAPLKGLTSLVTVNEAGNPGYVGPVGAADVPTLPEWGAILMGAVLLLSMSYAGRRRQR